MNKQLKHYVKVADESFYVPDYFCKFIERHKKLENLIIKNKNNYYCTQCKNTFLSNAKIGKELRCPNCKGKYIVRKFTLKNHVTKKDLILFTKIEDKFVLRVFELCSTYEWQSKKFKYQCTEYRRVFFDDTSYNETVESDIVFHTMGLSVVSHWKEHTCWKKKVWNWYYNGATIGFVCPSNIKSVLKGSLYQYSQLWKLVSKIKFLNMVELFQKHLNGYSMTFELLIRLRLYNLAMCCNRFGNTKKTFEERFGVSKQMLPFMQKYNITYEELNVLRCIKVPNIRLLRALQNCNNLLWLSYRVDLFTAWKGGLLAPRNEHLYYDYLVACEKLQYDFKDKKIIYPSKEELVTVHDKVIDLVKVAENELNDNLIKKRAEQLKIYTYKNKDFIIYCFQDLHSIIDEASQMGNCVFTNYSEEYALGKCNLYTVRSVNDLSKSLITVETDINNTRIVQAEQSHHRSLTDEQQKFLDKWLKYVHKKVVISSV